MANVLSDEKKQQVIALGRLGWTLRRYQRVPHGGMTSNRPVEDWGKLLGDAAAVSPSADGLDRLLHHRHVLKCGPRSWRTKTDLPAEPSAG